MQKRYTEKSDTAEKNPMQQSKLKPETDMSQSPAFAMNMDWSTISYLQNFLLRSWHHSVTSQPILQQSLHH